jgi:hypothetical protein
VVIYHKNNLLEGDHHPGCAANEASRLFLDRASTPPRRGGEDRPPFVVFKIVLPLVFLLLCGSSLEALAADKLQIVPSNPAVLAGRSVDLTLDGPGVDKRLDKVVWSSSDPTIASVDSLGKLHALKMGTATITAALGGLQASTAAMVTVVSAARFVAEPSDTPVDALIAPEVRIAVHDNLNQPVLGLPVTLSIGPNPPNPAKLRSGFGLTRITGLDGTVRYGDLSLDYIGNGYSLVATVTTPTGLFRSTSNLFNETRVGDPCLGPDADIGSCTDADNDGLIDTWERAGGVDFNGDGRIDPQNDLLLPGADPNKPDVYLQYDYMKLPDQGTACVEPPPLYLPDLNVYQYLHSPDCPAELNCISKMCTGHSEDPGEAAIQLVVEAYANHGINLHIDPQHNVLPHSQVITYGPPVAGCAGADAATLAQPGYAADYYDLKKRYFDPRRNVAYHYAVFGHLNTCDSASDCAACPPDPQTGGRPIFRTTGLARIVGNDIIISQGWLLSFGGGLSGPPPGVPVSVPDIRSGGTFMHELGHNLGLNHGGPVSVAYDSAVNFKPNYLSVMNYSFQFRGIGTASPDCLLTDDACMTTPVTTRLDYANANLASLDEMLLNETVGINSGTRDITIYFCPGLTFGAGMGPIDWNCNGDGGTELVSGGGGFFVDINKDGIYTGPLTAYADWPNLNFKFPRSVQPQ